MKKTLVLFFVLASSALMAQSGSGWGIKGGLNFNSNGKFEDIEKISADSKIGYHLGIFGKKDFGLLYFRPELVYTKTKSDYDGDDFDMSKFDLPLLLGVNILGPLNVFGGPSLQYILNTDFDGIKLNDVEKDVTLGLNVGVGLALGSLGIDLRYERGLSNNEAEFVGLSGSGRIDTRPSQLILSASIRL